MKAVMARPIVAPLHVRDDPHYRPHAERLSDLKDQLAGYDAHIARLESTSTEVGRKAIAQAIADGADVREIEPQTDHRALLRVAVDQRLAVEEAIKIVEERARIALSEARARFLDRTRDEHAAITRAMADALIAVGLAQEAATAFGGRLQESGAGSWPASFGPLGVCRLGVPTNQRSVFASWLAGAALSGALDINTIPSSWRQSWGMLADVSRAQGDPEQLRTVLVTVRKHSSEASAPPARSRASQSRDGW